MPTQRPVIRLTTKIVLLVAFMGVASGLITVYATWHMQKVESQYRLLLERQAQAANHIGIARHELGKAAAVVHAALVSSNEYSTRTLHPQETLLHIQQTFTNHWSALYALLPEQVFQLDLVTAQSKHMFAAGQRVLSADMQWQDDRALHLLSQSFTPSFDGLQEEVNALRTHTQNFFTQRAQELEVNTQQAMRKTLMASWICVLLICALAAWVGLRFVSLPITRLTHSMRRLRLHHYDTHIADQDRRDELGSMARALQEFASTLKEAEVMGQALAEHQKNQLLVEQLQQLTSALPGAVFQMDLRPGQQLKLRFVSPQWTKLIGLPDGSPSDVETASSMIRYRDAQVTAISEKNFARSAQTLEPVDFEVPVEMLDGVTRWIKTRANPKKQSDGSVIFNGVWLDVSKEIQQAQALKKAKAQAEQDAQARSTLQASISHEIRTPLNAILGMTQLILKADLPPTQREQLHNVLRAGQHLRGIVNEVLDFSKIDAGQLKLESTDFSLESVLLDVVHMCQEEAKRKNLPISYEIAPDVPDKLRGDPHRIAQILLNYVNNAIKFTACGHIDIALRLAPDSTLHRIVLHVSVTDTGAGIPADRIPILFEAFQQADNSITRRFGGTGLGLTISRALAQLMGGTAGVHSVLGQGSTFWFTAVLEPARTVVPAPQDPPPAPPPPAWQGQRILVVDDNPLNRAVAEGMLQAMGLQTEVAEDGAQALLKLQAVGPSYYSCVLMDLQMPHMDGISATQALRQIAGFDQLPVIAMTAHTGVEDVERTQQAGMNAHLSKPLLEDALHQVLQQWIGNPASAVDSSPASELTADTVPAVFDASAVDALAQLFPPAKLQQLVAQFTHDSLQRVHALPTLAQQQDWQAMRAEAHKLTGTAATFGLLQLGHWSTALTAALKAPDEPRAQQLVDHIVSAAEQGVQQLQAYLSTS